MDIKRLLLGFLLPIVVIVVCAFELADVKMNDSISWAAFVLAIVVIVYFVFKQKGKENEND